LSEGYIKQKQVEGLLKSYSLLTAILNSLHVELQAAYVTEPDSDEGEVIYALVVGNRRLDGMPKPPYVMSDKTCNVAFIYKQVSAHTTNAIIKRLSRDILQISTVLEKLDIAIDSLNKEQRKAIDKYYLNKEPVVRSGNLNDERRMKRERRNALDIIAKVMRLSMDRYFEVMEKLR